MKKKMFTLAVMMFAIIAISCGKKADEASIPEPTGAGFYYTNFADAKIAADLSGKPIVIDFHTDW